MVAHPSTYLLIFLTAVALVDLTRHKIPNLLTVSGAAVGLMLGFVKAGGHGVLIGSAGLLTGVAAFLPFYLARGFGAGDVKAMAAVGAFLGPQGALLAAAWSLLAGAVGALLLLLVRREHSALRSLAHRWTWRVYSACASGQAQPLTVAAPDDPTRRRFPYGLAIACGTVVSLGWS